MHSPNSVNSLQGSAVVFVLPLDNSMIAGVSKSSKMLQDVIAQLVKALTKDGQLDESSPLGKMLAKAMAANGKSGGDAEGIAAALDKLIHQKLGDNFGASAGIASGGSHDVGLSDLMTQVLNGLGKALLDDLLTKLGDGTKFSRDDKSMLDKIGQFMDDNKAQFPPPNSGSWMKELKEDNFLDADETAKFRSALDIISQQFGKQQSDASSTDGGLGSFVSDTQDSPVSFGDSDVDTQPVSNTMGNGNERLGQVLGELVERGLQSLLSGGGLGTPLSNSPQAETTPSGDTSTLDLGRLLGSLIEKGLEVSLQGNDLQSSAARTAAQIINTLLQGSNNQSVT